MHAEQHHHLLLHTRFLTAHVRRILFLVVALHLACPLAAQQQPDSLAHEKSAHANADDPSQFFTRIEVYNELQYYDKQDAYLNQTVYRTILKIGRRFTTRIDVPYVYNSFAPREDIRQSGIGDISFRLLGYKFIEKPLSAFTASVEISMNTAQSPTLGTGKNILIPVVSYTRMIPTKKLLLSAVLQQANSVGGDEDRATINFSKLQLILLKMWTPYAWTVVAPEWFVDYQNGGVSMNLRTRMTFAPSRRINLWVTPSIGVFGDFAGRYQWGADVGGRYFLFKDTGAKKQAGARP